MEVVISRYNAGGRVGLRTITYKLRIIGAGVGLIDDVCGLLDAHVAAGVHELPDRVNGNEEIIVVVLGVGSIGGRSDVQAVVVVCQEVVIHPGLGEGINEDTATGFRGAAAEAVVDAGVVIDFYIGLWVLNG